MDLSSLNVDVLFHLMKFVDPEDRLNLVLSGILKGFENVNEGIDLRERIEGVGIELGPRRDGTCQLEIRSLKDSSTIFFFEDKSRLITLERLADGGYFKNNRQVIVRFCSPPIHGFLRVIRSMTHLEKLSLLYGRLSLTQHLPQLFRSCPKLTQLHLGLYERQKSKVNEVLKNELRSGFQRLRLFVLESGIYSCSLIQEILTWLKECAQLTVRNSNDNWWTNVTDGSVTLNPDLAKNLRDLRLFGFPVEFVKWVLPFCPNIHTLKLDLIGLPNDVHNDIARLMKLKDLHIGKGIDPNEIIRNCRHLERLRVDTSEVRLEDLVDLEHNENITEVHLSCVCDLPVNEVLQMLKRCTHLRRLTLKCMMRPVIPPSEELCEFIMELKHLTFLHIIYCHFRYCNHFKSLVDEVTAFVLPRRPKFEFYVSCCYKFDESRVSRPS